MDWKLYTTYRMFHSDAAHSSYLLDMHFDMYAVYTAQIQGFEKGEPKVKQLGKRGFKVQNA